jgi:hypothetical protein
MFPIVGGRKVEHLEDNIKALTVALTDEQMKEIESVAPLVLGFPESHYGLSSALTGQWNFLMVSKTALEDRNGGQSNILEHHWSL